MCKVQVVESEVFFKLINPWNPFRISKKKRNSHCTRRYLLAMHFNKAARGQNGPLTASSWTSDNKSAAVSMQYSSMRFFDPEPMYRIWGYCLVMSIYYQKATLALLLLYFTIETSVLQLKNSENEITAYLVQNPSKPLSQIFASLSKLRLR